MQRDYSLSDRIEFSIWLAWDQPGLGISTIFVGGIKTVRIDILFFGVALVVWNRWDGE